MNLKLLLELYEKEASAMHSDHAIFSNLEDFTFGEQVCESNLRYFLQLLN